MDYWWLSSFTRTGEQTRALPGGVGFANSCPSTSDGNLTVQQLLRHNNCTNKNARLLRDRDWYVGDPHPWVCATGPNVSHR